jgi:hypothetical protein
VDRVDIVDLQGAAHTRGRALGLIRRERIRACLSDWLGSLRAVGIGDPSDYLARMLGATGFRRAIEIHAPDLLDEVNGIAAGAGEPFDLLLAAQLMDEEWAYRTRDCAPSCAAEKCSSVAVQAADRSVLIGQNMDLGVHTEGHQILLRIAPYCDQPGALIFSIASMIALFGVNSCGIGVCVNSLPQLPTTSRGLPVAFLIRKILQARAMQEAAETLRTLPHATGQHYLVADASGIRSFEASPLGVFEYLSPHAGRILHTNHPLAKPLESYGGSINSMARLECLVNRLAQNALTLETIEAALASRDHADHPVSRAYDPNAKRSSTNGMINYTTGSMISVLRQGSTAIESWVSPGPPGIHTYAPVTLPASGSLLRFPSS